MEKNLKQALDFKAKIAVGKMGRSRFGMVEIMNIDGHDLIRCRLIELSKSSDGCQIEILMNLPGGALFFLPTFKGTVQNCTNLHLYPSGRVANPLVETTKLQWFGGSRSLLTHLIQRQKQQWIKIR